MYKLDLEKAVGPEIKLPRPIASQKMQGNKKKSTSASLTTLKPLAVWMTTNWKILKETRVSDHLTLETYMHDKKQQLEQDME